MMCAIVISIVPLAFKKTNPFFAVTDMITAVLFIVDYFLRLMTADYKLNSKGIVSFIKYPI